MSELTIQKLKQMKASGQKLVMVTAYDYPSARWAEAAGVDLILVGDSLGVVVLGYPDTLAVTMDEMVHHTKAVVRGVTQTMVIADMPFMSYQTDQATALANAGRFLQQAGAQAVKLEGGSPAMVATVARLTEIGIPVLGHLGFTPQSTNQLGGPGFQGKTASQAAQLLEAALQLEAAGIFGLVLELVPWEVAELITARLKVPTIGIGSGPACDGQVLVYHDLLGLNPELKLKHNRVFAEGGQLLQQGLADYAAAVRQGEFPTAAHTRRMEPAEYQELLRLIEPMLRGKDGNDPKPN